jgi:hypothetical protein
MSFLKTSLEKRITELRASIAAQTTELAAYEQVLALESGKSVESVKTAPVHAAVVNHSPALPAVKPVKVPFTGRRSDFVIAMLKEHAKSGITPGEISAGFAAHKVQISKNLVYNVLSLLFKSKKVRKSNGRYFYLGGSAEAPKAAAPKVAAKKAAAKKAPAQKTPAAKAAATTA